MRTLTTALAALLAGAGVSALPAQHAHQFELGAFGSYTRYDRAFGLENQLGGGARLGYFFGRVVGAELDIGYVEPNATSGVATAELTHGSGSLVLNVAGGERHLLYILGGYTRLDFEKTPPYRFTDNAVHGALGDRVFLGSRAALRLEVRAIYAPSTHASFASGWAGHVVGSLGLSVFGGGRGRLPARRRQGRRPRRPGQVPQPPARHRGGRRWVHQGRGLGRRRRGRHEGQMPRHRPRNARRRFRLPDSLHPGADSRYPARCDLRDGPLGAEARVPYGARHRGSVAARQPGHPHRDRGLHRQHRRTGDEPAALSGPGGGGARLSRGARCGARADGGPGVRGREPDRTEHDARRPRSEPACRAASTPIGAQARRSGL